MSDMYNQSIEFNVFGGNSEKSEKIGASEQYSFYSNIS